ncbi:hypothetical protein DK847_06835 [Aestuariivirga litoralis]|uniref:Uncharacterized protein n=1 Tax=Aestuariivirga litoralis TaxID=2650924 RepID=A0A2W2BQV3_9HYPH|nr:hypothetical protein DK847_06835 [Aestuariivirga litoralis]
MAPQYQLRGLPSSACRAAEPEHLSSSLVIYLIACTSQDALHWAEEGIGNLRVALNALVRLFRL